MVLQLLFRGQENGDIINAIIIIHQPPHHLFCSAGEAINGGGTFKQANIIIS